MSPDEQKPLSAVEAGITRKRGKLSTEEENFIIASKDHLSIEDIAVKINRTTEPIIRFLSEKATLPHKGMSDDEALDRQIKARLIKKPFWSELKQQLVRTSDNDELQYFEEVWISLMKQFREDVTATEELEIKQWITLEILMNRSMREKKTQLEMVDKLQKQFDSEYAKDEAERDNAFLMNATEQLALVKNSVSSYTADHMKILSQIKDIRRDLKMARTDRIKKLEDGKISFVGLLKQLEDEDIRENEGLEAEVISRAADKAREKYSQPHKFVNDKYGHPILTPEVVKKERANEQ